MLSRGAIDNLGPIKGEIIERVTFETLTDENVFVKREAILVKDSGEKIPFANPEYIEYRNNKTGREELMTSGLSKNIKEAIFLIWGDTPTVEEPDIPPIEEPEVTPETKPNED